MQKKNIKKSIVRIFKETIEKTQFQRNVWKNKNKNL